jgi:hypothetical protein
VDTQAAAEMERAIVEHYPEIVLECVADFLVPI